MVAGDLLDALAADPVAARVPDVREVGLVAVDERRDERRAHALQARVLHLRLVDPPVRELDAADEPVLHVGERAVHLVGPGRVLVLRARVELGERVGRHLAGDLARGVAAHAIGDDEQLLVFNEAEIVLIVGALHPDVGLGGVADLHVVSDGRQRRETVTAES